MCLIYQMQALPSLIMIKSSYTKWWRSWLTGTTQEIIWVDDISGDVKIDLYKNDVFNSTIAATEISDGSFTWNIPGSIVTGSDYKILITSLDYPVLFDQSNASFTIFTGGITVSSPNGGESCKQVTSLSSLRTGMRVS